MFLLVVIGWTFFRARSLGDAMSLLERMFVPQPGTIMIGAGLLVLALLLAALVAHWGPNSFELTHAWRPAASVALAILLVACLVTIHGAGHSPFLYFQF